MKRGQQVQRDMDTLAEMIARCGFNPLLTLIADVEVERGNYKGASKLRKLIRDIEAGNDMCRECNAYQCDHQEINPETGMIESIF